MKQKTITVNGVDEKLSDNISNSIVDKKGYKYTHLKQMISRLRIVKGNAQNLPLEDQITIISNALITERNIANFAADSVDNNLKWVNLTSPSTIFQSEEV